MNLLSRWGLHFAAFAAGVLLLAGVRLAHGADPGTARTVGWRNDGSGHYPLATPPLEWSATKNILWKTRIGPNKYSSPIVVGRRIFLVADPAQLLCVNADDGKLLWQKSNDYADLPEKYELRHSLGDAGNTTPTPVSDGQFVYVVFGTGIVACYDLNGARQWIQHFDLKIATEYGRAASPVLAGGRLMVTLSYLMALDTRTGRVAWKNAAVPESYGTPVVARVAGVEVLVMPSGQIVRAADGTLLASDLGGLKFASPIIRDNTVYLIQTGSSAKQLSGGAGDKWAVKQLWDQELEGTFYASAIWHRGLIYGIANEYMFSILDTETGKLLVTRDLVFPEANARPASAPIPNMYASLVIAGKHLFMSNDQGDTLVLEPGREFKEVRRNHLGEGHGGAPAFDDRHIYLRSGLDLYCIGEK